MRSLCLCVAAVLGLAIPSPAHGAQEPERPSSALRVFLDCDRRSCDFEFIRQDIDFVDWVRNREDGQVHVLITRQFTGAGIELQMEFIGRGDFEGQRQTLRYASSNTDTDDERRRGMTRILRLGLAPFVAQTPTGARADLVVERAAAGEAEIAATPESDRWNFWTFSVGLEGNLRSEERKDSRQLEVNVRANRTTERWKIRIGGELDYEEDDFQFDDGSTFTDVARDVNFGSQVIRSLSSHWGAGIGASVRRSTFFNLDPSVRVAAALERNLYPYSESSQRQLTVTYFLGGTRFNYSEETIFEKSGETLIDQGLIVALDLDRPWGSASFNLEAEHFVQHPGDLNLQFGGRLDYRLARGLSLDLNGNVSRIRSQRFLARGGASDEEILLERRALQTDLRFEIGIGLRYTFGSIYNNVVNARIGARRGRFNSIF